MENGTTIAATIESAKSEQKRFICVGEIEFQDNGNFTLKDIGFFIKTTIDDDDSKDDGSKTKVYTDKTTTVTFNMIPENHEQVIQDFMAFIECPINCVSMESAAITHHGHLFEHNTINNYLSSRKWNMGKRAVCPITRQPLEKSQVVEFSALNKLLSYLKSDGKTCLSDDEKESILNAVTQGEDKFDKFYDTQIKKFKTFLDQIYKSPTLFQKFNPGCVLKAYPPMGMVSTKVPSSMLEWIMSERIPGAKGMVVVTGRLNRVGPDGPKVM